MNDSFYGRWNVTVKTADVSYPSWFELVAGDTPTGRFVGRFGSARPIETIRLTGDSLFFSLPPQYEGQKIDLAFSGVLTGGIISGSTVIGENQTAPFTAIPAPDLTRDNPEWGDPITLIGTDFSNWRLRNEDGENGWRIENGVMINEPPSTDIVTTGTFNDFKLHIEFKLAEHSNSGIYLRGRHEIQLEDTAGEEPTAVRCGAVYGFIVPNEMAVNPAGEWNEMDITFIGRMVTVVLNGTTIIDNTEIPGITGGALDNKEDAPGPLMLQGDHGYVAFRNIVVTPAL